MLGIGLTVTGTRNIVSTPKKKKRQMNYLTGSDEIRMKFRHLKNMESKMSLNQITLVRGINKYFLKHGLITRKQEEVLNEIIKFVV